MKYGLIIGALVLTCASSAFAQGGISISGCDVSENSIRLKGEADSDMTVVILKKDTDVSQLSDSNPALDVNMITIDGDGNFDVVLTLPANLGSGFYKAVLTDKNSAAEREFSYVSEQEGETILAQINSAGSLSQLNEVFSEENLKSLAISSEQYREIKEILLPYIIKHGKFSSIKEFTDFFYTVYGMEQLKNTDADTVLRLYGSSMGVEYSDYNALSLKQKTALEQILKTYPYTDWKFSTVYYQSAVLVKVQTAEKWSDLKRVIIDNNTLIGADMGIGSVYYSLNNKDNVFATLFKKQITQFSDIKREFNAAAEEQKRAENKSSASPGGGSGSGSSGSGKTGAVMTPQTIIEQANRNEAEANLKDIDGHWAKDVIIGLYGKGIISGYPDGTFRPDDTVTRAEFAAMMAKNLTDVSGKMNLKDLQEDYWAYPFIKKLYLKKIVTGDSDENFNPDQPITREDAAVILYRTIQGKIAVSEALSYNDSDSIADYAKTAVASLSTADLLHGSDGNFYPKKTATRAEAAAMIANASDFIG